MLACMTNEKAVRVIVSMRVQCANCGLDEDETSALELPPEDGYAPEEILSTNCPDCGSPISVPMQRWQRVQ